MGDRAELRQEEHAASLSEEEPVLTAEQKARIEETREQIRARLAGIPRAAR